MKPRTLVAGTCLAVLCSLLQSPTAMASAKVRIYRIYFNSPGSDNRSNTSINGEWIELKNLGTTTQNLYGWKIRDAANHTYTFGTYYLKAGYRVHVHTGKGTNSGSHRFWGYGIYVWNNTGDKATLSNKAGTTIDTCSYSGSGSYVYC